MELDGLVLKRDPHDVGLTIAKLEFDVLVVPNVLYLPVVALVAIPQPSAPTY